MSQGIVRAQQTFVIRNCHDVLVEYLFAVHDRTYLQEIELSRAVIIEGTGEERRYRVEELLP